MINYSELHCHSHYSLLDGASSPRDLLERAVQLGMSAIALTDHNNVYGAVEFSQHARQLNIQPILGCELTLTGGHHLTLLVRNQIGWANLCWLISQAQHNATKGEAELPAQSLQGRTAGLIALSGCRQGAIQQALIQKNIPRASKILAYCVELFGSEYFWMELQHHYLKNNDALIAAQIALAKRHGVGYVATNNVHYAHPDRHRLQDIMVCIRNRTTLDEAGKWLRPNSEYHLKPGTQMAKIFAKYPDALTNTQVITEQCQFTLPKSLQALPAYPIPEGTTTSQYLKHLCQTSNRCTTAATRERLTHELAIIQRAGLEDYFLLVWDIVRFARDQGIRCQGRGSAANSVVAYLLYISPIDPIQHDLVFERFLSDERYIVPDIDIDFDAARREEVIQYIYRRYGTEHAAMACTFITFRGRSAVRDVGKALGLAPTMVDLLAKSLDKHAVTGLKTDSVVAQQLVDLCQQIERKPRHLGIHNGGMILTATPITQRLPTEPASMPGRVVVQWDKDGLEESGIVKIDILGLRMLSAISEAVALTGVDLDMLTYDDPAVFNMISTADTLGVFQVESRAQMQMLPRFRPRNFADIIIAISLIRPGPIQGDMVHPYLRRRLGQEKVSYLHPLLRPALQETLGVILFQEQVIKVARDLAGFTAGQGELLRRALGKKDAVEAIRTFEVQFIEGALGKGVDISTAQRVFQKLLGFGSYSFPKSHAAAFAVLVYQSAWLRKYHPAAFYIALLNNQPMGFYTPSVIVNDAKRHNIPLYPVHINLSQSKCQLVEGGIRLGLNYVRGFGESITQRVLSARNEHPFHNLTDFCQRTQLPMRLVENLIQAGAMDQWAASRRDLIWDLGRVQYNPAELDLAYESEPVDLPPLSAVEALEMEYHSLGLSTRTHPMALYRDWLQERRIRNSRDLANWSSGKQITVAGQAIVRQAPPTAKGFQFITLEDEGGYINVILRPQVYQRFRRVIKQHTLIIVRGQVQREDAVVNVVATEIYPLPPIHDSP